MLMSWSFPVGLIPPSEWTTMCSDTVTTEKIDTICVSALEPFGHCSICLRLKSSHRNYCHQKPVAWFKSVIIISNLIHENLFLIREEQTKKLIIGHAAVCHLRGAVTATWWWRCHLALEEKQTIQSRWSAAPITMHAHSLARPRVYNQRVSH